MALAIQNSYPLSDQTDSPPGLTTMANPSSSNTVVIIAWKGFDNTVITLEVSNDGGQSFQNRFVVHGELTASTPSIAFVPGRDGEKGKLWMAWQGSDNQNLRVAQVQIEAKNQSEPTNPLSPPDPSIPSNSSEWYIAGVEQVPIRENISTLYAPTIAAYNNELFLAWVEEDSNGRGQIYAASWNNGSPQKVPVSNNTTGSQVALVSHTVQNNGNKTEMLFISWNGTDNNFVNYMVLSSATSTFPPIVFPPPSFPSYKPTTGWPPALASVTSSSDGNASLYLCWQGGGEPYVTIAVSTDNGKSFTDPFVSGYKTITGVAMTGWTDQAMVMWVKPFDQFEQQLAGTMVVAHI
jgi:hypothetical protein